MNNICQYRNSLINTCKALKQGSLTIGFIGGSITAASTGYGWTEPVIRWFSETFTEVRLYIENAAIGATGSDLAVLRVQRDLIDKGCDLIFIEYAVNDIGVDSDRRMRSREGLIRKLLAHGTKDVVLIYTYCQDMYKEMVKSKTPASISEFEQLGEHYGLSSVWAGLYSFEEIKKGRMKWEEWLPDGLHPQHRGSLSYAQSVIAFLETELFEQAEARVEVEKKEEVESGAGIIKWDIYSDLPQPLNPYNWEGMHLLDFARVKLEGPWWVRRNTISSFAETILSTSAIGAKLSFEFEGRGLVICFDFGRNSAEFTYTLDENNPVSTYRERLDWCGNSGWLNTMVISDELEYGIHSFSMEVIHGNKPGCNGTNMDIAFIGIIR